MVEPRKKRGKKNKGVESKKKKKIRAREGGVSDPAKEKRRGGKIKKCPGGALTTKNGY